MRFLHRKNLRLPSALPLSVFCAASFLVASAVPLRAQTGSAVVAPSVEEAVVTSVRGETVMLSEGSDAGVRVGSIFTLSRSGIVRAKVRVTAVEAGSSEAALFDVADDYLVTVGDTARYFSYETPVAATPTPAATPPPTPPPTPEVITTTETLPTPIPSATGNETPTPSSTGTSTPTASGLPASASRGYLDARITQIIGKTVTLNVGLQDGVKTGINVPVWRNGSVAAILRVQSATSFESTALITWQDDAAQALAVGDTLRLESDTPVAVNSGSEVVINNGQTVAPVAAAPILYETGASNAVVPRADRAYEVLAGLAAAGLIRSQPADVFRDDGILRHRTENDINFTRAQIGAFIGEAVENANADLVADANGKTRGLSTRNRAALGLLVRQFARELSILRVDPLKIEKFVPDNGFNLGFSGQLRASFVSGGNDGFTLPFSEPQGDIRLKSGADLRLNVFGDINKRLSFYSTFDATSKLGRNDDNSNAVLRRAVLSYDASNIARGLKIEVGKNEYWFGPGHYGTLLLSDVAGGLNSIHTQLKRGSFTYDGVYAALGTGPAGGKRSLYARNFQFQIGSQSRVGFAESLLASRSSFDAIDFAASLVPIPIPLSLVQRLRNKNIDGNSGDTNSLYNVYAETSIARGAQVYGEFLIDDISTTSANLTRNRLGTLLGAHLFTPSDPTRLGLYAEYTTLSGRTYFAQRYFADQTLDYNYFQRGDSLGYPNTPEPGNTGQGGADSFRFTLYGKPIKRLSLSAGFEFTDKNSEQADIRRQQVFRLRGVYNLSRSLSLYGRYIRVSTGRSGALALPPTTATQAKQSRFELGLAQSF